MKVAYLDCFSGVSGDMLLGALVESGVSLERLEAELRRLPVPGWTLRAEAVVKHGLRATKVTVDPGEHHPHRSLQEILAMIAQAGFSAEAADRATRIFTRLGEAEASIHGVPVERIHFHEVGAVDSIVDIVGAAIGFGMLGIGELHCSALNVGGGRVQTSHGVLPVPAPATAALLRGVPTYSTGLELELVTPTGAAIVTTLASGFGAQPPMRVETIGYGAGTADPKEQANVVRMFTGERAAVDHAQAAASVCVFEANVDDMSPELYGYFAEKALQAGALEVFAAPVHMKKNRPGLLITLLCEHPLRDAMAALFLRETTTIGVRFHEMARQTLAREILSVNTSFGPVRMKISRCEGSIVNAAPEFEDCRRIASEKDIPLKEVFAEALFCFRTGTR